MAPPNRDLSTADRIQDGSRDFDFLRGSWTVHNRRLRNPLDPQGQPDEFIAQVDNRTVLGGAGNIDTYRCTEFPGRPDWEALALRLFDAEQGVWRIWWVSIASPGQLDTPVMGRFEGHRGRFECDDVLLGRAVKVRYEWRRDGVRPMWRQTFSLDAGQSWFENWSMDWHPR